jgi:hypothetical protein
MGELCAMVFFVGLVALIVLVGKQIKNAGLSDAYRRLAEHYQGNCAAGGILSWPSVRLGHAGGWAVVGIHAGGGKRRTHYTQIQMPWPDPQLRMEVYLQRGWSRLGYLMGMQDIRIGSPEFDDRYVIKGNDMERIRRLLSGQVQWQTERLRRLLGHGDIYVAVSGGRLLLKKRALIRRFDALLEFTEIALELHKQAILTLADGIEFIETPVLLETSDALGQTLSAVCQICGDEIAAEVVYCRRCETPHHPDCWHYYGACSTYGCKETRYARPKAGRLVE